MHDEAALFPTLTRSRRFPLAPPEPYVRTYDTYNRAIFQTRR